MTTSSTKLNHITLTIGIAVLITIAPWVKTSLSFFIMEVSGLIMLAIASWQQPLALPKSISIFIFASILILSLYLIPLPTDIWLQLPGRLFYQDAVLLVKESGGTFDVHSISIDAHISAETLLAILPSLGIFIAVIQLQTEKVLLLVKIFIGLAFFQALWGLNQSSTGGSASGSYFNRDHYVALIELALPLAMGMFVQSILSPTGNRENRTGKTSKWFKLTVLGLVILVILLGGLFSLSRAGIGGILIIMLFSLFVFSIRLRLWHMLAAGVMLIVISTMFLASADRGIAPILNRFLAVDPLKDARWHIFERAWAGIEAFFPLGSGPGTFRDVYQAFQPLETLGNHFITNAHNDYLQLLFEMGLAGALIATGFFTIYVTAWVKWIQLPRNQRMLAPLHFVKAGAGLGILASLFHAFFDFNFHTYAHPVQFAFLAGIFFAR